MSDQPSQPERRVTDDQVTRGEPPARDRPVGTRDGDELVPGVAEPASEAAAAPGRPVSDPQPVWQRVGKRILGYAVLALFAVIFIYPFVLSFANSFKTRAQAAQEPLDLIPSPFTLEAYQRLAESSFLRWTWVSIVVTVSVTLARVVLNSMAGYALARLRFRGRAVVFALIVAVLAIPGIVLAIPRFIVMGELGMLNSWWGLIVPLGMDAFGIFMMKQFFESIPVEMEEAARVDGATIFQTFWRVVLPLAVPGLIALTILSFQGTWNEFLHILIAAPARPELNNLPVGLALLRGQAGQALDFPLILGGSMLTTIPVAIVFFTFQRYFVSGVAASGVKG